MKRCWCGNTEFTEYSDHYWKCGRCGTLVSKVDVDHNVNITHDDGNDFYGKDYWEKKMVAAAHKNTLGEVVDLYLQGRAVYWLKTLFRYCLPAQGHISEVGCGLGQFSYLLKESGYQQDAYELSPEICKYIRKTLNINIHCGTFAANSDKNDVFAAFDVLEHIQDPKSFLQLANESLSEQGILFLQTPCYNPDLSYDQMKQEAPVFEISLKYEEHVYLYSRESVTEILKRNGFPYVCFEPAFFGDDYDMFFVAAKNPIHTYTEEQINEQLDALPHGRLLKALIAVWDERQNLRRIRQDIEKQSSLRDAQISQLTDMVKERDARLQGIEKQSSLRETQIFQLTDMVKERDARLQKYENGPNT